jgi:hypothetical protein
MKMRINGKEQLLATIFISSNVHESYLRGEKWDSEQFCEVEIGGVLPAWITMNENVVLETLKTFEEAEQFATELNLRPILVEDFNKWKDA